MKYASTHQDFAHLGTEGLSAGPHDTAHVSSGHGIHHALRSALKARRGHGVNVHMIMEPTKHTEGPHQEGKVAGSDAEHKDELGLHSEITKGHHMKEAIAKQNTSEEKYSEDKDDQTKEGLAESFLKESEADHAEKMMKGHHGAPEGDERDNMVGTNSHRFMSLGQRARMAAKSRGEKFIDEA